MDRINFKITLIVKPETIKILRKQKTIIKTNHNLMATINFKVLMKVKEHWDLKKLILIKQDNIISLMEIKNFKIMKKVKKSFLKTIKKFKKLKNKTKIYKKTKINLQKIGYSPLNNKKILQKKKSIIQRIKVKNNSQTLKII
jgi:hypothetical protein